MNMDNYGRPGPSRRNHGGNRGPRHWQLDDRGRGAGLSGRGDRSRSPTPRGYSHGERQQRDRYDSGNSRDFSHMSPPRKKFKADPARNERLRELNLKTEQDTNIEQGFGNHMEESYADKHSYSKSGIRSNQNCQRYDRHKYNRDGAMGFMMLETISRSDSVVIIEKINQQKKQFLQLIDTPVDKKKSDIFALVLELVTNVWKTSFEQSKKLLLLDLCNTKFIDHLQLYLMQLPYTVSMEDKFFNKYYWNRQEEFWSHFMSFCECIINVSPSTAVLKCGALIEAVSKSCLDGLKLRQGFELPQEYTARMDNIRDSLKVYDEAQITNQKRQKRDEMGEPPESFRELSVLPTGSELLERRPFLRANVVEGAYSDVEHYLDVQFRLLREDCFGPLREGIHQFIEEPKKRRYDHIRVYRNVKFLEPFVSNQKIGSIALLDEGTMKMFKRVNWAHSKRFLFGSLVLFTKDNCRSFLVGTILERDEKYLNKRQLPVNIVNSTMDSNMYNEDSYIMIECEVYFEPYYHVLRALQDPSFPEHLAMNKYIVNVEKVPEKPAYLTPNTFYKVKTKSLAKAKFTVLQDDSWPAEAELGLNSTQYEAYKLALTHEFAVIQGPPGTGKTFLGVKVAETLLSNAPFRKDECCMLVICYTNHALDQFLEALLPMTDSIVRIGGRSRSEKMQEININNLRRAQGNGYYHSRRIELKMQITALEHEQARIDALCSEVLSYNTVVAYNDECRILEHFYRGSGIKDILNYWLFEEVDNIEIEPSLLEQQFEYREPDRNDNADFDAYDDDIFPRDELYFDDFENDDVQVEKQDDVHITTSFSLSGKEEEIKARLEEVLDLERRGYRRHELRDRKDEIRNLYSEIRLFKDMSVYRSRAPSINLAAVQDLTSVPLVERWSMYFKWANVVITDMKKKIKTREEKLQSTAEAYEEARMMVDLEVLKRTRVVGMTTSGAARLRKLLVAIAAPIVVVEEAAEVLEAHIVTSLTKSCQHLILIGDHQQLRPSAACMRLARHYQLEVSLFERMIRNGVHSRRLGVQHRMRPEIAALVAPSIYPDLRNHRSVEDFPPVRGVAHNLFFFSHDHKEQSEDDSSTRTNTQEADLVLRLASYLIKQDYKPEEVTILAAYSGQMFYMRKQRPQYSNLSNVKITVLDNYQGEESRIILLSLVRNNSNDSIGFLGTENRICVALSRAREGLFIFGNIEMLKRKSTLWTNIATTLESNGSLGTSMRLKCENHSEGITTVTSVEDFDKVPEGGCLLECKHSLACGHPCPRICHGYDLEHVTIRCPRDCDRQICDTEGHKCPLKCANRCQPCQQPVEKSLPCGHKKTLPCYMKPDDPSIQCLEQVTVSLPGCGHEADKQCYMKISEVRCQEKCPDRLNCGHACLRKCHVHNDPDHDQYICRKPCPKMKNGCTANLAEDVSKHKCLRLCFQDCSDCYVKVIKKRSSCSHSKKVSCCEDVDAKPCLEKCERSLPCGHHCKKLCYEKCGDCKHKITKNLPGCNHEMKIECGIEPTQEHQDKCTEISDDSYEAPCGHKVLLACNVYQAAQTGSVPAATVLASCSAPCGVLLRCGHSCSGSCAGCRQGRLHQPCAARCQQLNICGHMCSEPCNQVCPPCRQLCAVACPHSRCGKLCGAPCTPCTEAECGRACEHEACTRACGQVCDRAPCERACPRALGCGHPCRGLCGEPCPPVCRLCDPDNFPTDLLGDAYEDNVSLIQLQDCPHILDVDTLDTLMKSENDTIRIKTCPFCRAPIINTYRYKDLVNKMLKDDINPIKEKVYGTRQQRLKKRMELIYKVKDLKDAQKLAINNKYWKSAFTGILKTIKEINKNVSVLHLDMYHIYLDLLENVGQYYTNYVAENLTELKPEMEGQVKLICRALEASGQKISQQQQVDMGQELKRMNSIVQLSKILGLSKHSADSAVQEMAKTATEAVLTWRVYDEEKAVGCLKKLEEAVKLSGIASKVEREMVVRAIGLKAGHWYKCPNGHFYCIGECGGAMQLSRCPDCGAAIGGQSHRLTEGNQHAREMDGSRHAAWSEEANNMANFQLNL